MLAKKVDALTKSMEVEWKKMKREAAAKEKEAASTNSDDTRKNRSISSSKRLCNFSFLNDWFFLLLIVKVCYVCRTLDLNIDIKLLQADERTLKIFYEEKTEGNLFIKGILAIFLCKYKIKLCELSCWKLEIKFHGVTESGIWPCI